MIGFLGRDEVCLEDEGGLRQPLFCGSDLFFGCIFVEEEDHGHILGNLLGHELEVVGEREKDSQDQEGQADDCDGEKVPYAILPQVVHCLAAEILQFLKNQSASFRKSLPLYKKRIFRNEVIERFEEDDCNTRKYYKGCHCRYPKRRGGHSARCGRGDASD